MQADLVCAAIAALLSSGVAQAQAYPSRAVRIIVAYAPGGGTDVMARLFAPKFTEAFGQPFVAENRPGFGGNIGAELVARAPPDGYTLLMTTAAHAINVSLYAKFGYDPVRDFAPVTLVSAAPNMQSYEANVWFGLFAPAGTPPAVINRHLRVPIRDSRTIDEETRRSLQ